MTKLDEAVEAALAAVWKQTDPNGGIYQEMDMKAAIQAAVKVLVPEPVRFGARDFSPHHDPAANAVIDEILKNAGIK